MPNGSLQTATTALARLYPWSATASESLTQSLAFLGADVPGETVVRAGYGAAVLAVVACVPVVVLLGLPPLLSGPLALAVGLSVAHVVHVLPGVLAQLRRTAALGAAPDLVARAVLRMRVTPTVEAAAAFAARTGDGPLAASLHEHVRRASGTGESGFDGFAREWTEWFPELRRAVSLVEAAAETPAHDRSRTLDRALAAILDGTHTRMQSFASEVRGPATGLYAFGVLVPLALVSVLPAAAVAGLPLTLPVLAVVYDGLLPLGLGAASVWLLARRPVAFQPPTVPTSHPAVPEYRRLAPAVGVLVAAVTWIVLPFVLPPWTRPVGSLGLAVGVTLAAYFRPEKRIRDRTRDVEDDLPDALYLIGRRVADGASVEAALAQSATEVDGETGSVLAEAARRQEQLRVGVEEAFLGTSGPLVHLPSPRAHSAVSLLALAAFEGEPAGAAAVSLADHLEDLRDVECDARAALARVTDTLESTAAIFAPLVGGVTVALGDSMGAIGNGGTPLPVGGLGTVVGVYVCILAVLLTALSVGLARGLDRALLGYRCGLALLSATALYLTSFVAAGLFA